jgi:hypothetical protein
MDTVNNNSVQSPSPAYATTHELTAVCQEAINTAIADHHAAGQRTYYSRNGRLYIQTSDGHEYECQYVEGQPLLILEEVQPR